MCSTYLRVIASAELQRDVCGEVRGRMNMILLLARLVYLGMFFVQPFQACLVQVASLDVYGYLIEITSSATTKLGRLSLTHPSHPRSPLHSDRPVCQASAKGVKNCACRVIADFTTSTVLSPKWKRTTGSIIPSCCAANGNGRGAAGSFKDQGKPKKKTPD